MQQTICERMNDQDHPRLGCLGSFTMQASYPFLKGIKEFEEPKRRPTHRCEARRGCHTPSEKPFTPIFGEAPVRTTDQMQLIGDTVAAFERGGRSLGLSRAAVVPAAARQQSGEFLAAAHLPVESLSAQARVHRISGRAPSNRASVCPGSPQSTPSQRASSALRPLVRHTAAFGKGLGAPLGEQAVVVGVGPIGFAWP